MLIPKKKPRMLIPSRSLNCATMTKGYNQPGQCFVMTVRYCKVKDPFFWIRNCPQRHYPLSPSLSLSLFSTSLLSGRLEEKVSTSNWRVLSKGRGLQCLFAESIPLPFSQIPKRNTPAENQLQEQGYTIPVADNPSHSLLYITLPLFSGQRALFGM